MNEERIADLREEFIGAAEYGSVGCDGTGYAVSAGAAVFGFSLSELLKAVADKAIELGREYRGEIVTAARQAIDALVAMDIPGIPAVVEAAIDATTKDLAYAAVDAVLNAVLGPVAPPA